MKAWMKGYFWIVLWEQTSPGSLITTSFHVRQNPAYFCLFVSAWMNQVFSKTIIDVLQNNHNSSHSRSRQENACSRRGLGKNTDYRELTWTSGSVVPFSSCMYRLAHLFVLAAFLRTSMAFHSYVSFSCKRIPELLLFSISRFAASLDSPCSPTGSDESLIFIQWKIKI